MSATQERIGSLPKWARDHVGSLESRIRELTDIAENARGKPSILSAKWSGHSREEMSKPTIYLPREATVRFGDEIDHIEVCFQNTSETSGPSVASWQGIQVAASAGCLMVIPRCSNVVAIDRRIR